MKLWIIILLVVLAFNARVVAQQGDDAPKVEDGSVERIGALFAQLADREGTVRESARAELMGVSRGELKILQKVVGQSRPLMAGQSLALREIVMQAWLADEPYPADNDIGFLGVQLGEVAGDSGEAGESAGVLVVDRVVGFCGYRMLRNGDLILRVVDRPGFAVKSHAHLAALIRTFPAGATVELELLRQGRVVGVKLRLDARPLELREAMDLNNFQWRRVERFGDYWKRAFAPLLGEGVS